jgi:hypothetical protein
MPKKTPKRGSGKKPADPPKAPPPPAALPAEEVEKEGEPLAEEFERFFLCPLCGARVSVLLDPSVESQILIEDCEVCCQPLEIKYTVEEGKIAEFDVQAG